MNSLRTAAACIGLAAASGLAGCGDDANPSAGSTSAPAATGPDAPPTPADACLVRLHGKGGGGAPTAVVDGVAEIAPDGNDEGWGGRQWLTFPDDRYAEALDVVTVAVDEAGCTRVVVNGFSNGGSFAAALLCRGETFDGRLAGVVIDDPVPDESTVACNADPAVQVALYWTGALDDTARPGTDCSEIDWTCAGGQLVGIDAFAAAIGVTVQPSPLADHEWYRTAPEITEWATA